MAGFQLSLKCGPEWYLKEKVLIVEFSFGTFLLSVGPFNTLIADLATTDRTAPGREESAILFSSVVKVTSWFIPLSSDMAENYVAFKTKKKKNSRKVLIHIPYMTDPSIVRVSEGRFDAFKDWHFCLLYWYCFTMLSPNNADHIGPCDAASSTERKLNQSGIRWDVTSACLFLIGRWWHTAA